MSPNIRFEPSDPPLPNVYSLYDPDFEDLLGIDPRDLNREGEPLPNEACRRYLPALIRQQARLSDRFEADFWRGNIAAATQLASAGPGLDLQDASAFPDATFGIRVSGRLTPPIATELAEGLWMPSNHYVPFNLRMWNGEGIERLGMAHHGQELFVTLDSPEDLAEARTQLPEGAVIFDPSAPDRLFAEHVLEPGAAGNTVDSVLYRHSWWLRAEPDDRDARASMGSQRVHLALAYAPVIVASCGITIEPARLQTYHAALDRAIGAPLHAAPYAE